MNAREYKSRILPMLLSGTQRATAAFNWQFGDGGMPALSALSLTGQALRFESPEPPVQFALEAWPMDVREIVPDAIRALMLRLVRGARCTVDAELAIAWQLAKRKLKPHLFDLPVLDGFVRRHCEHLGVTAQYWTQRDRNPEQIHDYFDAQTVTEENWIDAPLTRRVRFLEEFRARDAAAARNLLRTVWSGEVAEARVRLLSALKVGIYQDDRPFLEAVAKDRAPRVRGLAGKMLARLTGTASESGALAKCVGRIQRMDGGLFKRRPELKLQLPATVKDNAANRWIHEQFTEVEVDELASALLIPTGELVDAAAKDDHLLFALSMMASREKRFEMLENVVDVLPDMWGRMADAGFAELRFSNIAELNRWAETVVRPRVWMPDSPGAALGWVLRRMEGPLPQRAMEGLLASKWWFMQILNGKDAAEEMIQLVCALCPREARHHLRAQLGPLEMERKESGWLLLEILENLENAE